MKDRKYKIGDRVIIKTSYGWNPPLRGTVNIKYSSGLYNVQLDHGSGNWFAGEMTLDNQYYRDIKLKELLSEV